MSCLDGVPNMGAATARQSGVRSCVLATLRPSKSSSANRAFQSRWFWLGWLGVAKPNERMQLTWLLGAPSRPASVHRRVVGRVGLGSPATQLMRAVRRTLCGKRGRDLRTSCWAKGETMQASRMRVTIAAFFGGIVMLLLMVVLLFWFMRVEIEPYPAVLWWARVLAVAATVASVTSPMWPMNSVTQARMDRELLAGLTIRVLLAEGMSMVPAAYGFALYVLGGTLLEVFGLAMVALAAIVYWGNRIR